MIDWKYLFGGHCGYTFYRYYQAYVKGMRVGKLATNRGLTYSVGNIDKAKKKYKSEEELIAAIDKFFISIF